MKLMDKAVQLKRDIVEKGTIPVDIISIVFKEGLKISYFNPAKSESNTLEDVSGLLDKANKTIYINSTESQDRQRFTLAHELAHFMYNHSEDKFGLNYRNGSKAKKKRTSAERQADDFAGEILIPTPILRKKIKEYSDAHPTLAEFASIFGVSQEAMRVKLATLGLSLAIKE